MASESATQVPIRSEVEEAIDNARQVAAEGVDKDAAKKLKQAEKAAEKAAKAAKHNAKEPKAAQKPKDKGAKGKDEPALIGITTKKEEDFSAWYLEVIQKAEFCDYSDVPGFFILPPASYAVWEAIKDFLDGNIKKLGVKNCYFPSLIAKHRLEAEKEHLEGFAAEVAWVERGGSDKLPEPYAIRPTSETAMYPWYATKIRSHRDLPLKLNQWNNVVRWEFKHAIPFIRSREFLWQEGHTAHLTHDAARKEVFEVLDFYAAAYEELLAVPVVKGTKTDNEKFAGADYTTTIEGFIPEIGRGIQAGTSHCLGQHFSKMFKITVEDPTAVAGGEKKDPINVWQNSWGFTTRSIGVMVMVHGDNRGLFIPPRVAEIQVVIIPVGITAKTSQEARQKFLSEIYGIETILRASNVRTHVDDRDNYNVGYKFNDWEMKGVPLRIEFGPKDAENHVITVSRRDEEKKDTIPIPEVGAKIPALLEQIQADMFKRADDKYRARRVQIEKWDDFVPALNAKNVCLIRHCLGGPCEDEIKDLSKRTYASQTGEVEDTKAPSMGAKSLCIPFEQPSEVEGKGLKCTNPNCKNEAKKWVLFGRSY